MKKIRTIAYFGLTAAFVFMVASCNKDTLSNAQLMDREESSLTQYLTTHSITAQPTLDGLYYLPTDSGTGVKPDTNDVVEFNYKLRLVNDVVIATNIDSVARNNNLYQGGIFYRPFKYRLKWWFKGLQEGFQMMREGGKARFIIPSQLAYGKAGYPSLNIGSYTTVIFDIELTKVIHDPVAYEAAQIEQYVHDSIPADLPSEKLDSGIYHITAKSGSGDFPTDYKKVSVRYIAKLLDGTLIEQITASQAAYSYVLKQDNVIPGFDAAVRKMKKGEEAYIIIPYSQAYGERPNYYVNLPPFSTLVYYLTLVDIQ